MYINGSISVSDADDLTSTVTWIIGKSLNESNVSHVVNQLRGFKNFINETSVAIVIKNFKKICGEYMNGN